MYIRYAVSVLLMFVLSSMLGPLMAQYEREESKKPVLDPFKVLIKRKKKRRRPVVRKPVVKRKKRPPPVPPLRLRVTAIAGENPNYVAVIKYKNNDHIVEKGWESPDNLFKVRNIYADKVEVYYSKAKSVKSFFF